MKFAMTAAAVAALMLITTQGANAQQECPDSEEDYVDGCDDERLNASMCLAEFIRSPATQTCHSPDAEVVDTRKCKIKAACQGNNEGEWKLPDLTGPLPTKTEVTVRYEDVHTLRNCGGTLKEGPC